MAQPTIHFHTRAAVTITKAFALDQTDVVVVQYERSRDEDRQTMLKSMGMILLENNNQEAIIPVEATYHSDPTKEPSLSIADLEFIYPFWSTPRNPRLHAAVFVTSPDVPQWRIDITSELSRQIRQHVTEQFQAQADHEKAYELDTIFIVIP